MSEFPKGVMPATGADIPALLTLLNKAYRGAVSQQGWTSEAHLIAGEVRTDETTLKELFNNPDSLFLKHTNDDNEINGCVNLQQRGNKLYLGMLSVSPTQQGGGIGKKLLQAADTHARRNGIDSIYMTVISVRDELIDWYKRHGYADTGKREPFVEDARSGKHLQQLEFMVLEKKL
jgi:ribosomal protein S18 acetylase RimI-like enzyme